MKTCPRGAKKYSYDKDCNEQSREICAHDPEETNAMVLIKKKEIAKAILGRKFSNIFPFPVENQNYHFELKKICKVKMKTHPKKAKK